MKTAAVILLCGFIASVSAFVPDYFPACRHSNFEDWVVIEKYCVKHFEEHANFDEAEKQCQLMNGLSHLVTVYGTLVKRLQDLSNSPSWIGLHFVNNNPRWLGENINTIPDVIRNQENCCVKINSSGQLECTKCTEKHSFFCAFIENR
ncbi:hypothetical protein GN956_G8580 [Arapaima gigas]